MMEKENFMTNVEHIHGIISTHRNRNGYTIQFYRLLLTKGVYLGGHKYKLKFILNLSCHATFLMKECLTASNLEEEDTLTNCSSQRESSQEGPLYNPSVQKGYLFKEIDSKGPFVLVMALPGKIVGPKKMPPIKTW